MPEAADWGDQAVRHPALIIASSIRRGPALLVVGAMSCAVVLSFGITRLRFETGQDTLLDPSSKISRDNARFQGPFGGDPLLILFEAPPGNADIEQRNAVGCIHVSVAAAHQVGSITFFQQAIQPKIVIEPDAHHQCSGTQFLHVLRV